MIEINQIIKDNSVDLKQEFAWFKQILDVRFKLYFGQEVEQQDIFDIDPPNLGKSKSNWASLLRQYQMKTPERLALLLALIPHVEPRLLDVFFTKNTRLDRPFSEFGGYYDGSQKAFLPTGQTLLFLLAADKLDHRFGLMTMFQSNHFFIRDQLLELKTKESGDFPQARILSLSAEVLAHLTHGTPLKPVFGQDFPAEQIQTSLDWSDLTLNPLTLQQVQEMETWIKHGDTLLQDWGMQGKIRPGFRALFFGHPGTGKTMTASLLGKTTGRDVYRIDLSMVVSKYIGETEKNLARVFQQAESKNWILFFDEADALFGRRSETRSAHDRYANQEVAYLLQRIESFDGIIILASNFRENIDEAFTRRFEAIIEFPMPSHKERLNIWQKGIPNKATLARNIDLQEIAQQFELTGGSILNVIRYASLEALQQESNVISLRALRQGIRRELVKEDKLV